MDDLFFTAFFQASREASFNKQVLKTFDDDLRYQVLDYARVVISVPIEDYLDFLESHPRNTYITSENITQASHIGLCHVEMCQAFERSGYKGMDLKEIGWFLHNDGIERSSCTEQKYGENVKGAKQFGLTFQYDGKWHLSAIGRVFLEMEPSERMSLISRILLRDPLYSQVFMDARKHDVELSDYMTGLTESTIKRRLPSVLAFCNIVVQESNLTGKVLFHRINR